MKKKIIEGIITCNDENNNDWNFETGKDNKMDNKRKYGLYKRIMKHDSKAIDEIESLEEAKELIKMITGNLYLDGEAYSLQEEYYRQRILRGGYIKDCLSCANSFFRRKSGG